MELVASSSIHRTSAMRGKTPPRGFVPSAPCWNPNVFSSLLQNQSKPTPRAATIFQSADRDLRNKRSPRHAKRSDCRAITRGSGGEQPTHIYSIPTSRLAGQQCRFHLLSATTGSLYGPTSCWMLPFCDDSFSSSRASPQKLKHQPGRWIFRCFLFDRPGVLPAVAEGPLQPRCPGWLRRLGVKSKDQPTCSEGEATAESKTIRSSNVSGVRR